MRVLAGTRWWEAHRPENKTILVLIEYEVETREIVSVDRVGPEKPQGGQLIRNVAIRYLQLFGIEVHVDFSISEDSLESHVFGRFESLVFLSAWVVFLVNMMCIWLRQ